MQATDDARIARVRRVAARFGRYGYTVRRISEADPRYWELGPFMIVDDDVSSIISYGLDLDQLEEYFSLVR